VSCKWVFKVKNKPDGSIDCFKARLVAKGYSQQPGIDYTETFASVVRLNSLRSLLAYAVSKKLLIHQIDVVTAFLNGTLAEEVYMEQPPGYVKKGQENLVCYLQRSLYGLKQSSRCWNKTFTEYLKELKFVQLKADCCIFKREEPLTFIALYVDDVIVIAENDEIIQKTKLELSKRFQMKDMGPLHYTLGITCIQDQSNGKIGLMQGIYIDKLIDRYGLNDSKVVSTPSDPNGLVLAMLNLLVSQMLTMLAMWMTDTQPLDMCLCSGMVVLVGTVLNKKASLLPRHRLSILL